MNTAQLIESHEPPVMTASGELTTVPANDNLEMSEICVGLSAWKKVHGPHYDLPIRLVPRMDAARQFITAPMRAIPPVIALTGPAGSGKSTVSDYLAAHYGYTKTKFAKPLKDMMRAIGLDEDEIEGHMKEVPTPYLGMRTPRHAMQTLGTEWGRKCMGEDFWVDLWAHHASTLDCVVVDDCRFPNEAAAVRRMGGRVIRLDGRGGIDGNHASEAGCGIADEVICNDGSIADLQARVRQVLEGW